MRKSWKSQLGEEISIIKISITKKKKIFKLMELQTKNIMQPKLLHHTKHYDVIQPILHINISRSIIQRSSIKKSRNTKIV